MDFVRSHFDKLNTFSSQNGTTQLRYLFCEEKSVQLISMTFFRSVFLQNPYCSLKLIAFLKFGGFTVSVRKYRPFQVSVLDLNQNSEKKLDKKSNDSYQKDACSMATLLLLLTYANRMCLKHHVQKSQYWLCVTNKHTFFPA